VGLAAVKFGMVAAYFMHLKFDGLLLRRLFVTGIILAFSVFTIALVTMDVLLN
jgi:cytochrome c oxidase subunit 4